MKLSGSVYCQRTKEPIGARIAVSYLSIEKKGFHNASLEIAGTWAVDLDVDPENRRVTVTYYPLKEDRVHALVVWDGVLVCADGECKLRPVSLPWRGGAVHFPVRFVQNEFVQNEPVAVLGPSRTKELIRSAVSYLGTAEAFVGFLESGSLESVATVRFADGTKETGRLQPLPGKAGFYQFTA